MKLKKVKQSLISRTYKFLRYTFIIVLVIGLLFTNFRASQQFTSRMQSGSKISSDTNIKYRINEPVIVFSNISFFQFLTGSGLNPPSKLYNERGINYNALHIGLLNIVWRFGLLIFLIWFFFFLKLVIKWVNIQNWKESDIAVICIAPSIFIFFLIGMMSGGYGVVPFLVLGILLGLFNKFMLHIKK